MKKYVFIIGLLMLAAQLTQAQTPVVWDFTPFDCPDNHFTTAGCGDGWYKVQGTPDQHKNPDSNIVYAFCFDRPLMGWNPEVLGRDYTFDSDSTYVIEVAYFMQNGDSQDVTDGYATLRATTGIGPDDNTATSEEVIGTLPATSAQWAWDTVQFCYQPSEDFEEISFFPTAVTASRADVIIDYIALAPLIDSVNRYMCSGDSAVVLSDTGSGWTWSGSNVGETGAYWLASATGTYTGYRIAQGCTLKTRVVTVATGTQPTFAVQSITACVDVPKTIEPVVTNGLSPYTYIWSDGDSIYPGSGPLIINPDSVGTYEYYVTVTNSHGCVDSTSISVQAEDCCEQNKTYRPSEYKDDESLFEVALFPNPVGQEVMINADEEIRTVNFITIEGRFLESHTITSGRWAILQTEHFAPGIYLVEVRTKAGNRVLEMVRN